MMRLIALSLLYAICIPVLRAINKLEHADNQELITEDERRERNLKSKIEYRESMKKKMSEEN